jgi:hypothetical protein
MPNALHHIHCYWTGTTWAFDDAAKDLHGEPFVAGADKILTSLVTAFTIRNAFTKGFGLIFSDQPFPGFQVVASRGRQEHNGFWYVVMGREGWLCPAMFRFFPEAPLHIFIQIVEAP